MEILSKQETFELIASYYETGLLNRVKAADFLSMSIPRFDAFIKSNPHLKRRNNQTIRYCPKELKAAFKNS